MSIRVRKQLSMPTPAPAHASMSLAGLMLMMRSWCLQVRVSFQKNHTCQLCLAMFGYVRRSSSIRPRASFPSNRTSTVSGPPNTGPSHPCTILVPYLYHTCTILVPYLCHTCAILVPYLAGVEFLEQPMKTILSGKAPNAVPSIIGFNKDEMWALLDKIPSWLKGIEEGRW